MAQGDSSSRDLDRRTRELDRRGIAPGAGMHESQMAQNQLQAILNEQRNNVAMSRAQENQIQLQNQTLAQAGQILAENNSGRAGIPQFNPQTQAILQKYQSAPKVQKTAGREVKVTPNNITINNNYKTETVNNVSAGGGPTQGRPIMFREPQVQQSGGTDGGASKFKAWLGNVFENQKQESIRRTREFDKREWSLTKSANKMMRRIESAGKDIAENMNPQVIGTTVRSQLQMLLFIFGTSFLAKHWTKVLNIFVKVSNYLKDLLDFVGVTKEGQRLANVGGGLRGSLISFFGGNPKRGEDLFTVFKRIGTELMDYLKKKFDDGMEERGAAIKAIKFPKVDFSDMSSALKGITGYLADILTAMVDPRGAIKNQLAHELENNGNTSAKMASQRDYSQYELRSAAKNTDVGDYSIETSVNGKKKYSLNSNALDGRGELRDTAVAEISQGRDILGVINDARATGQLDTARLAMGFQRMQNNARSTGGVYVDQEFVTRMFNNVAPSLIQSGKIQPVRMKYVVVPKEDEDYGRSYVKGGFWKNFEHGFVGSYARHSVGEMADKVGLDNGIIGGYAGIEGHDRARNSGGGWAATAGILYGVDTKLANLDPTGIYGGISNLSTALGSGLGGLRQNKNKLKLVRSDDPDYRNLAPFGGKEYTYYNLTPDAISTLTTRYAGPGKFEINNINQIKNLEKILTKNAGGEAVAARKYAASGRTGPQKSIDLSAHETMLRNFDEQVQRNRDEAAGMTPTIDAAINNAKNAGQNLVNGAIGAVNWVGGRIKDMTNARNATFAYDGQLARPDMETAKKGWNVRRAIDTLQRNAKDHPTGYCSRYVQMAIGAGFGHSGSLNLGHAHMLPGKLGAFGFAPLSWEGYQPKAGDVYVSPALPGHQYGHVAMFDGQQWISDFRQRDMWGGEAYRAHKRGVVFRHLTQMAPNEFNPEVFSIQNGTEQDGGYYSGVQYVGGGAFSGGYYEGNSSTIQSYSGTVTIGGSGQLKADRAKFWNEHSAAWYNVLKSKGYSDVNARKFAKWFTAQDGFESNAGTSNAARKLNNFGGMQSGGKNISYASREDYMRAKLNMMETKFGASMRDSGNFGEFVVSLGNTSLNKNGYVYYTDDPSKYVKGAASYYGGNDLGTTTISYTGMNQRDAIYQGKGSFGSVDFGGKSDKEFQKEQHQKILVAEAARFWEKYPELRTVIGAINYEDFSKKWTRMPEKERQGLLRGISFYLNNKKILLRRRIIDNDNYIDFIKGIAKMTPAERQRYVDYLNKSRGYYQTMGKSDSWVDKNVASFSLSGLISGEKSPLIDSESYKSWVKSTGRDLNGAASRKEYLTEFFKDVVQGTAKLGKNASKKDKSVFSSILFGDYEQLEQSLGKAKEKLEKFENDYKKSHRGKTWGMTGNSSYQSLKEDVTVLEGQLSNRENASYEFGNSVKSGDSLKTRQLKYNKYQEITTIQDKLLLVDRQKREAQRRWDKLISDTASKGERVSYEQVMAFQNEMREIEGHKQSLEQSLNKLAKDADKSIAEFAKSAKKNIKDLTYTQEDFELQIKGLTDKGIGFLDGAHRLLLEYGDVVLDRIEKLKELTPGWLKAEDLNPNYTRITEERLEADQETIEREQKEMDNGTYNYAKMPASVKLINDMDNESRLGKTNKNYVKALIVANGGKNWSTYKKPEIPVFTPNSGLPLLIKDPKGNHVDFRALSPFNKGHLVGGYTTEGPVSKVAGIVHAGEWVAPQSMVKSRRFGPIIRDLEKARITELGNTVKNGTYKNGGLVEDKKGENVVIDPLNAEGQKAILGLLNQIATNTTPSHAQTPSPKQIVKRTI